MPSCKFCNEDNVSGDHKCSAQASGASGNRVKVPYLLRDSYSPLPGPTEETMTVAVAAAAYIYSNTGVNTVGILGVSTYDYSTYNFALSANLMSAVRGHVSVLKGVWTELGAACVNSVERRLLTGVEYNKGCAEKKLITTARLVDREILSMAVVAYPPGANPRSLAAHVSLSGASDKFYKPCETCRIFWNNYVNET